MEVTPNQGAMYNQMPPPNPRQDPEEIVERIREMRREYERSRNAELTASQARANDEMFSQMTERAAAQERINDAVQSVYADEVAVIPSEFRAPVPSFDVQVGPVVTASEPTPVVKTTKQPIAGKTLDMLKAKSYDIFDSITDEETYNAQIRAVKWITSLGNMAGTDVTGWDIGTIFGDGNGLLVTEKKDINARFFAHRDGKGEVRQVSTLTEEERNRLVDMEKNMPLAGVEDFRRRFNEYLSTAYSHYREYMTNIRRARGEKIKEESFTRPELRFIDQIGEIERAGFWKWDGIIGGKMFFITAQPLHLTYVNKAQGVDIQVNLGLIAVWFRPSDGCFAVDFDRCEDLQWANGYMHPHVDGGGDICLGTAGEMAARAAGNGNITQLMAIIQQILTEYNPESPYERIASFNDVRNGDEDPVTPEDLNNNEDEEDSGF
jgi:hypothetical protein